MLLSSAAAPSAHADEAASRKLFVATVGYELNEAAALQALASGADINWQNPAMNDESILIMAIKGQMDSRHIKFLIDHGANVNIKDGSGMTALDYANKYNLGSNSDGRKILALLQGNNGQPPARTGAPQAARQAAAQPTAPHHAPAAPPAVHQAAPVAKGVDPVQGATKGPQGAPTPAEVKATIEKTFHADYRNHFTGADNKVTFEWLGPIQIGAREPGMAYPTYPVKIQVRVTAEDPRDGNRSTVVRGINADYGFMKKREMYRFFKNGFGEWEFNMYEL